MKIGRRGRGNRHGETILTFFSPLLYFPWRTITNASATARTPFMRAYICIQGESLLYKARPVFSVEFRITYSNYDF